jgi:hypothetical protein
MRFEQAWVLFGAAIAAIVLLGTQRSFQSRAYDTALRSLNGRVDALEQNYAGPNPPFTSHDLVASHTHTHLCWCTARVQRAELTTVV